MKTKAFALVRVNLFVATIVGGFTMSSAQPLPKIPQANAEPTSVSKSAVNGTPFRNQPSRIANRARAYYGLVWGVEALRVKVLESGEIVRFSYRVIDAEKAAPLNDKKVEPLLISPEKGVKLIIPTLEKVGQLRQSSTPEAGKSYWMAFSNKGGVLKRGDRVNVVIGNFHASGLEIE